MTKILRIAWLITASSLLLTANASMAAPPGHGKTDLTELPIEDLFDIPVVTLATGYNKPVNRAPSVVSVITAEMIEQMGARTVFEALESVPGIHIYPSPTETLAPQISMRGIHANLSAKFRIMRNGAPIEVGNLSYTPPQFRAPVANIARIEIIRGPASAVHGTSSLSGIINIITKSAEEVGGTVAGARVGSFNSRDLWLQSGATFNDWQVAFSLELSKSDGDQERRIESDLQTSLDKRFGTSASNTPGSLQTHFNYLETSLDLKYHQWSISLWNWREHDRGVGIGAAPNLDLHGQDTSDNYYFAIEHDNREWAKNWQFKSNYSYVKEKFKRRFILFPRGARLPIAANGNIDFLSANKVTFSDGVIGSPAMNRDQHSIEISTIYRGLKEHRLRLSAGLSEDRSRPYTQKNFGPTVIDDTQSPIDGTLTTITGTAGNYMHPNDRNRWFVALQDEWHISPDLEFTAGVRYDHYADFGDTTNPRAGLIWAARHNLTTKLLYGRAFRAPSPGELYFINNPSTLGNPDLKPETIDTLEFVFDYIPKRGLSTTVNTFYYDMDDVIEFTPDPGASTNTAKNLSGQKGYGLEADVNWKQSDTLSLRSNLSWQHSAHKQGNARVGNAPGVQFHFSSHWLFYPRWSANLQMNWIGERKRPAGDSRPELDDYMLIDTTLRYQRHNKAWHVALGIRNLFDENAREASVPAIPGDLPLEGRAFFAQVDYKLSD